MYLESSDLDRLAKGSVEAFMAGVLEKAEAQHGKPLSVIATHTDHAFAVSDDEVIRIEWQSGDDGLDVRLLDSGIRPKTRAAAAPRGLNRDLRAAVQEMLNPSESASRNRLRQLCADLAADEVCWLSDCVKWAQLRSRPEEPWLDSHDLDKQALSSVEGRDAITSAVPRTPYARIPSDRISDFESELRESLAKMVELASPLEALTEVDDDQAQVRTRLAEDAAGWVRHTGHALELAESEDAKTLAEYHDLFASQLRRMLVMRAYISPEGATA